MKAKKLVLTLFSTLLLTIFFSCNHDVEVSTETLKAPSNLTVTKSTTKNAVDLTWKSVEGATYYWIYYNTSNDTSTATFHGYSSTTNYTITLTASDVYFFWVKSANSTSTSAESSDFSSAQQYNFVYESTEKTSQETNSDTDKAQNTDVSQDTSISAPVNLTATLSTTADNTVNLAWNTVSGIYFYWVYYGTENDSAKSILYNYYCNTTECSIKLTTSGTYYFWVKAAKGSPLTANVTTSNFSTVASINVFTYKTTLTAPSNLKASLSSEVKNTVDLSWDKVSDIDYYWIYYSTENNPAKAKYYNYTYSPYSTTITASVKLSESGTYYFWVKAATGSSFTENVTTSDFSAVASFYFTVETLTAPTNLTASLSTSTKNTIDLTWDSVDGINYYWVYYGTENDSSKAKCKTYVYNNKKESITLSESGNYYFWVKSATSYYSSSNSNNATSSDFSSSTSFEFTHVELSAPTNLKAEKCNSTSYQGIKLSWDSAQATWYHIYWATENDSSKAKVLNIVASRNSYTVFANLYALTSGTTYYFWVKSSDDYNSTDYISDFSEVVSLTY